MINAEQKNIPADILEAIKTSQVYDKLEEIGGRYNLLLDQIGQLEVDTRMLMIGKTKSTKFIETITKNLEISTETAEKIASDINTEIFTSLRESMQKIQSEAEQSEVAKETEKPVPTPLYQPPTPDLSHIEKAGNFTIEKRPSSNSPQYNDSTLRKEAVLSDLENIKNLKPENANAFVEHLLANPVTIPQQVEVKKPVSPPPAQKYGADPYREQV
jgi:hypothetical protein